MNLVPSDVVVDTTLVPTSDISSASAATLNLDELLLDPWQSSGMTAACTQQPQSPSAYSTSSLSSSSPAMTTMDSPPSVGSSHSSSGSTLHHHQQLCSPQSYSMNASTPASSSSSSSSSGSNSPKIGPSSSYFDAMLMGPTTNTNQHLSPDYVNIDMMMMMDDLNPIHTNNHIDFAGIGEAEVAENGADLNELLKDVFVENSPSPPPALDSSLDSSNSSSSSEDQETEALLDNIERMLNSMQQEAQPAQQQAPPAAPPACQQPGGGRVNTRVKASAAANKPIKVEPVETAAAMAKPLLAANFKKISPKIQPASNQRQNVQQKTPAVAAAAATQPPQSQQLTVLTACSPIIITTASATPPPQPAQYIEQSESKSKRARSDLQAQQQQQQPTTLILVPSQQPQSVNKSQPPAPAANSQQADPNLIKKQYRMIKNRESACLSRKRKKEYLQSLEENLKYVQETNETLKKENQELKNRVAILESENKQLKQQQRPLTVISASQKIATPTTLKTVTPVNINLGGLSLLKTASSPSTTTATSLKRPFIMLAIFFVFGLNIFQFINLNSNPSSTNELGPVAFYAMMKNGGQEATPGNYLSPDDEGAATERLAAAALAMAQARDGALIDGDTLLKLNSRHLLAEDDDDSSSGGRRYKRAAAAVLTNTTNNTSNGTRVNVNGMDLVLINGTWHVVDLRICQQMISTNQTSDRPQYFNLTHITRMNSDLDGWYRRHLTRNPTAFINHKQAAPNDNMGNAYEKYTEKWPSSSSSIVKKGVNMNPDQQRLSGGARPRVIIPNEDKTPPPPPKQEYPLSLYDTQSRQYETFVNSVRQRNDTFYFVSFRRDHAMFPALHHNRSQRPRMSFLMPAMLATNLSNSSSKHRQQTIAFMQIDCEVVDTHLVHFKLNEIPTSYMKIIHQDYVGMNNNQPPSSRDEFFNAYYASSSPGSGF